MSYDKFGRVRCDICLKYCRPFDSRTVFGCADPENPEPYDPEHFCRKCSTKRYKDLLRRYQCCYRSGDWQKSDAEVRAAKESGLVWIGGSSTLTDTYSGRHISHEYLRQSDLEIKGQYARYMPYLEYQAKRRDEKRCKCWRKKNEQGNCPTCTRDEVFCLCCYQSYDLF